jgi:hypothetical protein
VEALASVDGQELKNLGQGGRDLKNKAQEFIAESRQGAPNAALLAEVEALKARNAILEEDAKVRQSEGGDPFENMTLDMLRDFIATNTGRAPHGSLNRKTLVRMATEAQSKVT